MAIPIRTLLNNAPLHAGRPVSLLWYLPWLVPLGVMSSFAWFLIDDAYVTFRYARNLLEGHGLVYNPGEYVEGYSNFLWLLELALLWGIFGLRPEDTVLWLSVVCTVGTLAGMLWWVARLPGLPHRGLVGWMALGLVCSSATFAVWTPALGMETRQFTLFIVLAVVGLTLYPERRRALLGVSLCLTMASLTRPEGPLFAGCCFGWYTVQRWIDTGRWGRTGRAAASLVAPFIMLVAGYYLFRNAYYGEWLPNTYYAKYIGPYYERGVRYLLTAAVETGLYLLLPLAALSLVRGWRERRKLPYALPLLCIGLHMAYFARIGGGLFEYRMLDVYWPLLGVPAATGIVHLGMWASSAVRHLQPLASLGPVVSPRIWALMIFLPVVFYCGAIQATLLFAGAKERHVRLTQLKEKDIGWLLAAPGMPALIHLHDRLRNVARVDFFRHGTKRLLRLWQPYQNMQRGIIPADAVALTGAVGIRPYFLPDLKFIDSFGLTDATIARTPVPPNRRRHLGHDRLAPAGYLEKRINFKVYPAAASVDEALEAALYTVQVGPALWLPFDAPSRDWVSARFEQFTYNMEAHRRFEEVLETARLLVRGPFDVYLDGQRLLYVSNRCAAFEPSFIVHIVPRDTNDLPLDRRQFGFENRDFNMPRIPSLKLPGDCAATRTLPFYPIAALRLGQYSGETGEGVWFREVRFADGDWNEG